MFMVMVGLAGVVVTVIANTCGVDEPHALVAVTEMVPLVAFAAVVMDVVADVPVHPAGNVHV